jgi:hypothetical protein
MTLTSTSVLRNLEAQPGSGGSVSPSVPPKHGFTIQPNSTSSFLTAQLSFINDQTSHGVFHDSL